MLEALDLSLSFEELMSAALLAFFITWFIKNIIRLRIMMKNSSKEFGYPNKDINQILQRCYALFPKEIVQFRGKTYKRGMKIQIVTLQKKSFEGELIGSNSKNMVCILTKKYIIAHEITNIEEIKIIENA